MEEKIKKPRKSGEIFVTQRQLELNTQSSNERFTSLQLEMRAGFKAMDARMTQMLILLEDQQTKNNFVLDGYSQIYNKLLEHDEKFEKIDKRFEQIDQRLDHIDIRLDKMDLRLDSMDRRLDKMDLRLDNMDQRLDKMDLRFDQMDQRFDQMDQRFDGLEVRFSENDSELQRIKKHIIEH